MSYLSISATKFFTLGLDKLDEVTGRALATELTRERIWNCIIVQSGKYKGVKFGVNKSLDVILVNDLIIMIKERNKLLKQDQPTLVNSL